MSSIEQTYNAAKVYADEAETRTLKPAAADVLDPSFFIVGAQKAGTTSLIQYLVAHPQVVPPKHKEIAFFSNDNKYALGIDWYRSHFNPPKKSLFGKSVQQITGDASANYLECLEAAERMHAHYPKAKIVILLRNPADRAFSHHKMASRYEFDYLDFEAARTQEEERLNYGREVVKPKFGHDWVFQRLSYLEKGKYAKYLKPWLDVFPKEQLLILQYERFFEDAAKGYQKVLDFLGLDAYDKVPFSLYNTGGGEKMKAEVRAELLEYYQPYNQELFALIGEEWDWK